MYWLDQLKKYKNRSGKTYAEIAAQSGVSLTTIEKMFSGRTRDPRLGTISKIAKCLGCTVDDLTEEFKNYHHSEDTAKNTIMESFLALDTSGQKAVQAFINHELERVKSIANANKIYPRLFYDFPVSAGTGEFLDDSTASVICLDSPPPHGTDYILRISGNSMEPMFSNGDYVYVQRTEYIDFGEIGIFVFAGNVYIKEYTQNGLRSLNPDYPTIEGNIDIRCLGRVLGKVCGGATLA